MFLDRVKIWVRAGDGGDGAATFRREAHVPRGGPDGGDGGRGGSIYLRVDPGETTLRDYQLKHHFRGEPGGRGDRRTSATARPGGDLDLKVPPGTGVFDDDSGTLLADLVSRPDGCSSRAAAAAGSGNVHFATSTHQTPRARAEGRARRGALARASSSG